MELLRGGGAPPRPSVNLAVAQLQCECGGKVFRTYPLSICHYNKLNPGESQPTPVGCEMECIDCGKFAAMVKEEGKLPRWEWRAERASGQKKVEAVS